MQRIADNIERGLNNTMEKEIDSKMIGALIMDELRDLDQVAYVRFASVYHRFTDVDTFVKEINSLLEKDRKGHDAERYVKETAGEEGTSENAAKDEKED